MDITVEDVKAAKMLDARGLSKIGKKAALVERLLESLKNTAAASPAKAATPPPPPPPPTKKRDGGADAEVQPTAKRARPAEDAMPPPPPPAATPAPAPAARAGAGADESSSDDDVGPAMPTPAAATKKRVLQHEKVYLEALPSAALYEKSYMHRSPVSHTVVAPKTDFVITASVDGHLKFWKKMKQGIEFVKHYKAHLGAIASVSVSPDGRRLCSTGEDEALKFYDVLNFDMIHMIKLSFTPSCCTWIFAPGNPRALVAVADKTSRNIYVYNPDSGSEPVHVVSFHRASVECMVYNPVANVVISGDSKGLLEYWDASTFGFPVDAVRFKLKMETDLFDLAKARTCPTSLAVSPDGKSFAVTAKDSILRVFRFATGKLRRKYDEGVHVFQDAARDGTLKIDAMDFGRRVAFEKEWSSAVAAPPSNAIFDQTGHFLLFPTLAGIKVLNIETSKLCRVLGQQETTDRFLAISLYQGIPKVDSQFNKAGRKTATADAGPMPDPVVFAAAFKKNRFYCFSTRTPTEVELDARDIFNEAPTKAEQVIVAEAQNTLRGSQAVIHTTMGDITIKLFTSECPRTIENFCTHSRNGYYNATIFHRVIKGFMVQCGDPKGDGTGGESIWGGEFEDEIHRDLRHDRPYTVSMANGGPNTNGSQFFITTVPTPWLDGKHTVFGRVVNGMDTVKKIEETPTGKQDKPFDDIKIINVAIS